MLTNYINANATPIPDSKEIINQLFPNGWVLIAHLVATVIVVLLLTKWVWKPMKSYLAARTNYIQTSIDGSKKMEEESAANLKQSEETIVNANNRAAIIVEDGKKEAFEIIEKSREKANSLAKKITSDADIAVQQQKRKMEAEMKQEIVELSIQISEKLISNKISQQEASDMVEAFIKEHKK